ncbi:MAG: tetratricopeptide repeat protein [Oligoflexales bacterium]
MSAGTYVSTVLDLWMRCRFQEVVTRTSEECLRELDADQIFKLKVLRSQALYELHRVDQSKKILNDLVTIEPQYSNTFLYAYARLCYIDGDFAKAKRLFSQLRERSESTEDFFNACLGLAYTFIEESDLCAADTLAEEMLQLVEFVSSDKRMSLGLLRAHLAFYLKNDLNLARLYLGQVTRASAHEGWTFWIIKCLFTLAQMEKTLGKLHNVKCIVDLLGFYLDPNETIFQIFLINIEFKDQNVDIPSSIEFDQTSRRICINQNKWIDLQDKPIIFNFLFVLHSKTGFVSKQTIARSLWPEALYKPRVHDPRIFDIVKRTRQIIESYENHPVILLSGRTGYKLAITTPASVQTSAVSVTDSEETYSRMEGT